MPERTNFAANEIIERLGGTAEVSRMFDVRMPSVSNWKRYGIPKARMIFIQAVHPKALRGLDVESAISEGREVEAA